MTQQEFTQRVNVEVSNSEFEAINVVYMNSELDKDEFCKMWVKMNKTRIGKRIAELRKAVEWTDELGNHRKGMTQLQLAERCEIRQSNLARIEGGKYATTTDILSSIAEALGHRIDFIK